MEFIWEAPEEKFVKINVHCTVREDPLPNGNTLSVGVIIRNSKGEKLWGAFGPLHNRTEEQAIMTAIQAACIQALKREWDLSHIETVNRHVYDTVRLQDQIILDDEVLEYYGMFNTIYANNFKKDKTQRVISCIPLHMNSVAEYLAVYGLNNAIEFVEVPGFVGDLLFLLERDMGRTLPLPFADVIPDLGAGEVIDGSPPRPLKKRRLSEDVVMVLPGSSYKAVGLGRTVPRPDFPFGSSKAKGKTKIFSNYAFNDAGLMSAEALNLLDGKKLVKYSEVFAQDAVDLNAPVGRGFMVKDVLHHEILGSSNELMTPLDPSSSRSKGGQKLVSVEEVLRLLGFDV